MGLNRMITLIRMFDIGFDILIETWLIKEQMRTGDTVPNSYECCISFKQYWFLSISLNVVYSC